MTRLFGTDGVRGIANDDLTPELAFRLGRAGCEILRNGTARPVILVGKDTRLSGGMLEGALVAGICSAGGDAVLLGTITTPAVAYLVAAMKAQGGVMISASHNPAEYNGIKFFDHRGYKLPDAVEDRLEAMVKAEDDELPRPTGKGLGRVEEAEGAREKYLQYLMDSVEVDLSGLKVVVDCANGAAAGLAPEVLERLGVLVHTINHEPNGLNINLNCGSTDPRHLVGEVMARGADLGLALDGDADRVIAVDEKGRIVDGDHIMAICGVDLMERGKLAHRTVVATVMSNLGLEVALKKAGGRIRRTRVGDRYVLEEMVKNGFDLGGEQSGHIIFRRLATTGDGILTALQLLQVLVRKGKPLSELASLVERFPQVLVNVRVKGKELLAENQRIREAVARAEEELGELGRIVVRPSGTEPVVRVMLEGKDEDKLKALADRVACTIRKELGGGPVEG